ncbi:MAG: helix-hairpin-helix domain-containing protein [Planctomycetota bacterium]
MPSVRPILFLIIAATLLAALTTRAIQRPVHRQTIEPQPVTYRIDINTADEAELCLLPGVAAGIARRIIHHRNEHGPFTRPSQLEDVPFIGPKKRQAIEPWVVFD